MKRLPLLLFLLVAGLIFSAAFWANRDLAGPRAFLDMDEKIAYDGVHQLLTADSPSRFWWALSDGSDHRYGRIFYNVTALCAALPYHLFGDAGLVVAIRTTQACLLLGAYLILCCTFLRTWTARALALVFLSCLPYTEYYLTMPKPEPVQLFCVAVFLALAQRRKFGFGWHWLFLGLAFGAKISAAPLCAAAGLMALLAAWLERIPWLRLAAQAAAATGTFLAGWLLAIPMFFTPSTARWTDYLNWTFRATGHGSDSAAVTPWVWLQSIADQTYVIKYYLTRTNARIVVFALCAFALAQGILWMRRNSGGWRKWRTDWYGDNGWVLLGLGAALFIPIILMVKRLWGFYLLPGETLAVVGLVAIGEKWWLDPAEDSPVLRWGRWSGLATAGCLLWAATQAWPALHRDYLGTATRSLQPVHVAQAGNYHDILDRIHSFIQKRPAPSSAPIRVFYDPFLYLPDSEPGFEIAPIWNAKINWELRPELVVLGYEHQLKAYGADAKLPDKDSASYAPLINAAAALQQHVAFSPAETVGKPYLLLGWLGTDVALIVRTDCVAAWQEATRSFPPLRAHHTSP